MIEQQIKVKVFVANPHMLLPGDKAEIAFQFEQKTLQFAQDGTFEILFAKGVRQAEKIEKVRISKNQVRADLIARAEFLQLLSDQCIGLTRDGRAFEQHPLNPIAQDAHGPGFPAAQFA
jgi:hypothetical protein